jgi:hypothetical protein
MSSRWLVSCLSLLVCCAASATSRSELLPGDARLAGIITEPALAEISGLAVSRRNPDVLWTHNDSNHTADIFAIDRQGRLLATVRLRGVANIDFEDIAAFELDGVPYLLVADVGDNGGIRRELQLHVLREPDAVDGDAPIAWTVRFRWPDGPRDCEGVAVDARNGEVLLASKKRVPPELFSLSLRSDSDDAVQVARPLGLLGHIAQPSAHDLQRNPVYGRYRSQVTALDLSPDGRQLAVLNYLQAYVYSREDGESWGKAVARQPRVVPFPWLAQAEAVAFDIDGRSLWVSTERLPAPLLRLPVPGN